MHSMDHIKFSVMPTTSSISHRNTFSYFVDYSMKKLPSNAFVLYASCTEGIKCIVSFWAELFVYFGFETFCCLTTTWKSQRSNLYLVYKLECHLHVSIGKQNVNEPCSSINFQITFFSYTKSVCRILLDCSHLLRRY